MMSFHGSKIDSNRELGDLKMNIKRVESKNLISICRRFLAKDPVVNLLPLGDLYQPLFSVSDVYCATENNSVVGACSVYRAFSKPSLVLSAATAEVKQALIKKALALVLGEFIAPCSPEDAILFTEHTDIVRSCSEQQMITTTPRHVKHGNVKATRVRRNELDSLNTFYVEHGAETWTPIQFKTGPYYCVKQDGKIVSAAGVHIVTPQIAQLGNIITDDAYRNQGFGTACTSTLAGDLASKGRIISLFVRVDNSPAIHIYEKLGFTKKRGIAFLTLRKKTA
jgi:ribosomal protein S18 acetylase RimI-like enzyme